MQLSADNLDPALRLTFTMRALRPTIFVPCHAQTKSGLALIVDELHCSNSVSLIGQKGGEPGVLHDIKFWDIYEDDDAAEKDAEEYLEQKIVVNLMNTWVETHTGNHLTKAPVGGIDVSVYQVLEPMSSHLALDMHASVRVPECRLSIVRDDYVLVQSILVSNIGAPQESLMAGVHKVDAKSRYGKNSVSSPDFAVASSPCSSSVSLSCWMEPKIEMAVLGIKIGAWLLRRMLISCPLHIDNQWARSLLGPVRPR